MFGDLNSDLRTIKRTSLSPLLPGVGASSPPPSGTKGWTCPHTAARCRTPGSGLPSSRRAAHLCTSSGQVGRGQPSWVEREKPRNKISAYSANILSFPQSINQKKPHAYVSDLAGRPGKSALLFLVWRRMARTGASTGSLWLRWAQPRAVPLTS